MQKNIRRRAGVALMALGLLVGLASVGPVAVWGAGAMLVAPVVFVVGVALATPPIGTAAAAAEAAARRARIEARARSYAEGRHPRGADGRWLTPRQRSPRGRAI